MMTLAHKLNFPSTLNHIDSVHAVSLLMISKITFADCGILRIRRTKTNTQGKHRFRESTALRRIVTLY